MNPKLNWPAALLLLLCSLLFITCRKQNGSFPVRSAYKAAFIDSALAAAIAARITPDNQFQLQLPNANETVSDGFTIRDDRHNPSYYIFSYREGGFIVISAERNMSPVLGYTSKGSFDKKVPYGLMTWLRKTSEAIDLVRSGVIDNSQAAQKEWQFIDKRMDKNFTSGIYTREPPIDDPCATMEHNEQPPLLQVTWGQGCLYNSACPAAADGPCGRAWTGCVATAMAQVMHYWKWPASYNWASMSTNSGDAEVARLMRDAGNAVGMSYSGTGSGAPHENIDDALRNTFGFTFSTDASYNISTVLGDVQTRRPVILSGYDGYYTTSNWLGITTTHYIDGHEWVCDGYDIYTNPCMSVIYMHMNWGWHEWGIVNDYSGWFRDFNWAIPGTNDNFQYYKRTIVGIIK